MDTSIESGGKVKGSDGVDVRSTEQGYVIEHYSIQSVKFQIGPFQDHKAAAEVRRAYLRYWEDLR